MDPKDVVRPGQVWQNPKYSSQCLYIVNCSDSFFHSRSCEPDGTFTNQSISKHGSYDALVQWWKCIQDPIPSTLLNQIFVGI